MRSAHGTAVVRQAEDAAEAAHGDGATMRRAAFGLAGVVASELYARTDGISGRRVVLLVGSGGNGGDALWAGAFLARRGVAVVAIVLDADRVHAGGLAALLRSGGRTGGLVDLTDADLVVDGIVGLSARGALRPAGAAAVDAVRAPVVAVDVPSGVDPDTGRVDGPAVRAAVTVTFGTYKPVHLLGAEWCGRVELVELGFELPSARMRAMDLADVGARWPVPGPDDDKYSQGVVGLAAGSSVYPGAAVLCTRAAVAATSGMVRYAGTARAEVLAACPEVVATEAVEQAGRVQAWVVGPGSGTGRDGVRSVRDVLDTDVPVLLDADALTVLARNPGRLAGRGAPTVLTPHAGEFERLTGSAPGPDRVADVRSAAARLGATVLLKGRTTIVAAPDGRVLVNVAASSWVSTAGAGDVLSGVLGALLAAGVDPLEAAGAAAGVHVLAGELAAGTASGAGAPVSASTILNHLRPAIGRVRAASG